MHSPLHSIEHVAIDSSGDLGSLYNEYFDSIVQTPSRSSPRETIQIEDPVKCDLIDGSREKSQNLLALIGMRENARLNTLLNFVPRNRLTSIINHPYPIDKYTRLIYYCYTNRNEKLPRDAAAFRKLSQQKDRHTGATHIITSFSLGIGVILIIQLLPNDQIVAQVDKVLRKCVRILKGTHKATAITSNDENLMQQNTSIVVYSNISYLTGVTSLRDVCQFINRRDESTEIFRPLAYNLNPIQLFYPEYAQTGLPCIPVESSCNRKIEEYLLQYLDTLKRLKQSLDSKETQVLSVNLEEPFYELQRRWLNLKNLYEHDVQLLKDLVNDIRHGRSDTSRVDEIISNKKIQTIYDNKVKSIVDDLHNLEHKEQWIADLIKRKFQYYNVGKFGVLQTDSELTIKEKLNLNDSYNRILCSTDHLNKNNAEKFNRLHHDLVEHNRKNPASHLTYADFSYCRFPLKDITILSSQDQPEGQKGSKERGNSSSTCDNINILLLGETGVGKSTFINALANYLIFETLDEAETSQPVVLMPVSFMITTGDHFEEHIVKFGDSDDSSNEDFSHAGQSVTQRCKSYTFQMGATYQRKLRIIDTPGFGDTRGIEQDDMNMQHILEYINNLTHLNAICFLLKPNSARLHISFQSYLTQLFSLLDPNALNNIIFCFTSARSTFYTPGDTAPIIKTVLSSLSIGNVPFSKKNVFCFDSESFRYLVARQNKIRFDNNEKEEYEMSWKTSASESKRLIEYIRKDITVYRIDNNLQSLKHAQFTILGMVRPILETIRNSLRNLILCSKDSVNARLELDPKVISHPSTNCMLCVPYACLVGQFWVAKAIPHEIQNNHCICECSPDQHTPIHYMLNHKVVKNSSKTDRDSVNHLLVRLCRACAQFSHFLRHSTDLSSHDPFFVGLIQLITEETHLCNNYKPNDLNTKLVADLRMQQKEYDKHSDEMERKGTQKSLADIYDLINTVREYPMMREQLVAINEGQRKLMKLYECEVSRTPRKYVDISGDSS
ncbi:unnamed protein product [Rotaria magnacalcarata]